MLSVDQFRQWTWKRVDQARSLFSTRHGRSLWLTSEHALRHIGLLDAEELRGWLRLHGAVLRAEGGPLDDGESFDEQTFTALEGELGAS